MTAKFLLSSYEEVFRAMDRLLARLADSQSQEQFLDGCLDELVRALEADRALILLYLENGTTHAAHARRRGRSLEPYEREEIAKSIARHVLETKAPAVWQPAKEGDTSESMVALGIATAAAAPLRTLPWQEPSADAPVRGALYVDFRSPDLVLSEPACELISVVANVVSAVMAPYNRLERARDDLRAARVQTASERTSLDELLAPPSMSAIREELTSGLTSDAPVLVLGESGTGKTQLAQAIAEASKRFPIVRAVLGSSDDLNTITSELFGHEKGAFSGALRQRTGLVEYADGGTLIFDEILNVPPPAQQLLLDFTQFGNYRPLGYEKREPKKARVRLIAATNGDLSAAIKAGRFREDLYYRLSNMTLEIPPLRARRAEIPGLAESILRSAGGRAMTLSPALRALLVSETIRWSGNVRQLEAVIKRARERALARDEDCDVLGPEHVTSRDLQTDSMPASSQRDEPPPSRTGKPLESRWRAHQDKQRAMEEQEKALLTEALEAHGGVAAKAARALGLSRTSLLSRLDTLGIRPR